MGREEKNQIKELFQELKNGNEEKLTGLYNKCHKVIYGIAFGILKNKEDAEDIVQLVFEKLIKLDKEKLPEDKETTWLYTVTKNEALSFIRKNNSDIDLEEIYNVEDTNNDIEELIDIEAYNKLISKLSPKEKEIVSLKVLSDLSFNEIGQLLGEPSGTIKWRYYKAVNTLKMTISNLAMFVISFVLGLSTFNNRLKTENQDTVIEDKVEENNKTEINGNYSDSVISGILGDLESSTSNINTVQSNIRNNYLGYGLLGMSTIFFILTISCAIVLGKHKQKLKRKSSK